MFGKFVDGGRNRQMKDYSALAPPKNMPELRSNNHNLEMTTYRKRRPRHFL